MPTRCNLPALNSGAGSGPGRGKGGTGTFAGGNFFNSRFGSSRDVKSWRKVPTLDLSIVTAGGAFLGAGGGPAQAAPGAATTANAAASTPVRIRVIGIAPRVARAGPSARP